MLKVLQFGDAHTRDKDIDESKKCLEFIVDTARAEKVDVIIDGGDTFDSKDIRLDSQSARLAIKTISEMADICPVFIVKGTESHDGMTPEILAYAKGKHKIHVATMPVQIKSLDPDIVVSLLPQPTKQFFQTDKGIATSNEEIGKAMSGILAGFGAHAADYKSPHILVFHGSISGAKLSNSQVLAGMDIEVSVDQLKLSGAQLILCNHIHLRQEFLGNIFYSSSIYPVNWGENHEHGFYIHTLEGNKVIESRFIQTPCRRLVRYSYDLTDDFENYTLMERLLSEDITKNNGASIRLDLTTWQDQASKIDSAEIKEFFAPFNPLSLDIRITRIPREAVRSESVLIQTRLRDKLVAMAELRGETVSESILLKADQLESGAEVTA